MINTNERESIRAARHLGGTRVRGLTLAGVAVSVLAHAAPGHAQPHVSADAPSGAGVSATSGEGAKTLETVVVSGERAQVAEASLQQIAGGVSVVRSDEYKRGSATNAADVLANEPGVITQTFVSETGRQAEPFITRNEAGSFGFRKNQLTQAQVDADPRQVNPTTVKAIERRRRARASYVVQDRTEADFGSRARLSLGVQLKHTQGEYLHVATPNPASADAGDAAG